MVNNKRAITRRVRDISAAAMVALQGGAIITAGMAADGKCAMAIPAAMLAAAAFAGWKGGWTKC